jgi:pimeloyl-ACP methyl ester carboxylesterase/Fe-S cluster assembly iron-binding protein IscA
LFLLVLTLASAGCGEESRPTSRTAGGPPPTATAETNAPKEKSSENTDSKGRVVLTPAAAEQARKAFADGKARYVRVCVGDDYRYKVEMTADMNPADDYLEKSRGVPVVVDHKSAALLAPGIIVDFAEKKGEPSFLFRTDDSKQSQPVTKVSLAAARRDFKTKIARHLRVSRPAAVPPPELFRTVQYDTPAGKLAAYLSPDPGDGKPHPVIIWITGGDCNSIGKGCWEEDARMDQSASGFRKAGVLMMFPALRGGNDSLAANEGYFGEVDDVLAAMKYLRVLPFVDPYRIYLGGHSTGATLALLAAESSDDFRAVFAIGPVSDVSGYEPAYNPFARVDMSKLDPREVELRAPGRWLESIHSPVFMIDGEHGNAGALRAMEQSSKNPNLHFVVVPDTDHFRLLTATTDVLAKKVVRDAGSTCNLSLTVPELEARVVK